MKVGEIREMADEQILDEIEDLKEAMFKLRLQQASGQLENTNTLRYTRRDIARCQTVLRERLLAAQIASEE
jgi:large subunit ribosomal protein L29